VVIPGDKDLGYALGIIDIHLAAESLDKKFLGSHGLFYLFITSPTPCQFKGYFSDLIPFFPPSLLFSSISSLF
jgi:hypothetical protein